MIDNGQLVLLESHSRNGANLGFEEKLWQAADKLRGNVEPAAYKHIVLGLVFLKYIFDSFSEHFRMLEAQGLDPENVQLYAEAGVFWVPPCARWPYIAGNVQMTRLGELADEALAAVEQVNPSLNGIFGKVYSQSNLDGRRLKELITLIGTLQVGDRSSQSLDVLGRVYEYFLGKFAGVEGKAGEFYTPRSVVQLLVEMVEPFEGIVYDPCCGSGGMFIQSRRFVEAHGGNPEKVSVYGQELNPTTWRLCKMNLAMRGIRYSLGDRPSDTLHDDLHPQLQADYILSNPPFNISDWGQASLLADNRWRFGVPPRGNANWAWIQHIVSHLGPNGLAGFVLANGTLSTANAYEAEMRRALVQADLLDCIVMLPSHLFYTTQIAASIWILAKSKASDPLRNSLRNRQGETLLIQAADFGTLADKTHRELSGVEIERIAALYRDWRSVGAHYRDIPGVCKSVTTKEISHHKWALVPGRYVGFDRTQTPTLDIDHIRTEIELVEERLEEAQQTSQNLLATLRGIVNG